MARDHRGLRVSRLQDAARVKKKVSCHGRPQGERAGPITGGASPGGRAVRDFWDGGPLSEARCAAPKSGRAFDDMRLVHGWLAACVVAGAGNRSPL